MLFSDHQGLWEIDASGRAQLLCEAVTPPLHPIPVYGRGYLETMEAELEGLFNLPPGSMSTGRKITAVDLLHKYGKGYAMPTETRGCPPEPTYPPCSVCGEPLAPGRIHRLECFDNALAGLSEPFRSLAASESIEGPGTADAVVQAAVSNIWNAAIEAAVLSLEQTKAGPFATLDVLIERIRGLKR